jgi:putative ABC transport system permease protein
VAAGHADHGAGRRSPPGLPGFSAGSESGPPPLPALPGALLGIPLGIALFKLASGGGLLAIPPAWWLAVAVLGILAGLAVLTSIPARIGARQPVAEVLQAELA